MTRENKFTVRFSDDELETIKAKATENGLTVSDYLRDSGLKENGGIGCGDEILKEVREIHEDADKVYLFVQEFYQNHNEDIADIIYSRLIEQKILEVSKKLRYVTYVLGTLEGAPGPYESLSFSEYKEKSKFYEDE